MIKETLEMLPPERKRAFSVSDITRNIRLILEENFSGVWIEGELSNFKRHTSGHMYFSLKDDASQIQCVMFRTDNARLNFEPGDGLSVLCYGRVSLYAARGQYQLYVERIEPKGVGALQIRFEELKAKLQKEGFFDAARKREIPFLPRCVGIVTSVDGAALQDILNVLGRRFPSAHLLIAPVPVQGAAAAPAIAAAIEDLNTFGCADTLIVARGGGSLEDLWAFNEEVVARAIFDSRIPVISGVGHETDFTIADFVADLRAPTPSAAAEIVFPIREELLTRVLDAEKRLGSSVLSLLDRWRESVSALAGSRALTDPLRIFDTHFQHLDELIKNRDVFCTMKLREKKEKWLNLIGKLEALGPLATLKRGFSATLKWPDKTVVISSDDLRTGDLVKTLLSRGSFISQVKEMETQP